MPPPIHGYPKSRRSQFLVDHARRLSVGVWTGYAEEELVCYVDETLQDSLFNESTLKRFRWTSRLQKKVNQLKLILIEGQGFTIPGSQILGARDIRWPLGVDIILGMDFLLAHQELFFIIGASGTYLPQRFLTPPAAAASETRTDDHQLEVYTDTYRRGSKVGVGVFFGPASRNNSWYLFELDDDGLAATWAIWCVLCVLRKFHPDIPEKPVTIYTTSDVVYRDWISPLQVGDGCRNTGKSSGLAARHEVILKLASSIATEFHVSIQSIYCVKPTPNGIHARQASRLAKLATEGIEGLGELDDMGTFCYKIQADPGHAPDDNARIYRFDRRLVRNTLGMISGDFLQAGESEEGIPDEEEEISFPHPPFTLDRPRQENHVANGGGEGDVLEGLVETIAETIKKSLRDKLAPQYSNGTGAQKSRDGLAEEGQLLLEASAKSKRLRMQAAAELEQMKNTAIAKTEAEIGEMKQRVAEEIANRYQKAAADIEERYRRLRGVEDEFPRRQRRLDAAEKEIAERKQKADAEISEQRKNVAWEIARARQSLDAELEGLRNQAMQPRAVGNAVQAKMALHEERREREQSIRELQESHSRAMEDLLNKGRNASARDRAAIAEVRGRAAAQMRSDKEVIARLESEVKALAKVKEIETTEWCDKVSRLEGRLTSSAKRIKDLENEVVVAERKGADEVAKAREAAKKEKQKLAGRERKSLNMVKELDGKEAQLEEKAAFLEARMVELKEIDGRNKKSKEELAAQQAVDLVRREELLAKEKEISEREKNLLTRQEIQTQEALKKLEEISAKEVQILNLQKDLATLHDKEEKVLESARAQKKNIIAAAQAEKERVLSRLAQDKEATGKEIAAMNSNYQALKEEVESIRMEKDQLELGKERAMQHVKEVEERVRGTELLQKALRQRAERIILDAKVEAEKAADKIAYVGSVLHGRERITPQTIWDMYVGPDCSQDHWLRVLNTRTRGFTMRQMIDHNPEGMVKLLEDLKKKGRLVHAVELWRDPLDANGGWKYKKGERLISPAREEQVAAFTRGDLGPEPLHAGDVHEGDPKQVQKQGVELGA